jgi:hypothetical protein
VNTTGPILDYILVSTVLKSLTKTHTSNQITGSACTYEKTEQEPTHSSSSCRARYIPLNQHMQWLNTRANNMLIRTVSPFFPPVSPSDS